MEIANHFAAARRAVAPPSRGGPGRVRSKFWVFVGLFVYKHFSVPFAEVHLHDELTFPA